MIVAITKKTFANYTKLITLKVTSCCFLSILFALSFIHLFGTLFNEFHVSIVLLDLFTLALCFFGFNIIKQAEQSATSLTAFTLWMVSTSWVAIMGSVCLAVDWSFINHSCSMAIPQNSAVGCIVHSHPIILIINYGISWMKVLTTVVAASAMLVMRIHADVYQGEFEEFHVEAVIDEDGNEIQYSQYENRENVLPAYEPKDDLPPSYDELFGSRRRVAQDSELEFPRDFSEFTNQLSRIV